MGSDPTDTALQAPLGAVVGEGAEATIHVVDANRVIRVAKGGRSLTAEAEVMRYAAEQGCPVPAVHAVSGDGTRLLLERVHGPSLLESLLTGEIGGADAGELLGLLHRRVHAIEAPPWLPRRDDGEALLHLDLHPANVLLGRDGPMVIDWPNAAAGPPGLDVGDAYLVMASFPVPPGDLTRLRDELLASFLAAADVPDPTPWFATVIDRRGRDPHFSAEQLDLMRAVDQSSR